MADYRDVSDETLQLFNEALDATSIPDWIEFRVLADDNAKKVIDVQKQNDKVQFITDGVNAIAIINEEIFDGLVEDDIKLKIIDEELSRIKVDLEKGTLKVEQHDFSTNSDFLEKHGADEVLLLHLSVQSLYDAKKQKEEEEKAAAKEAKKKNKK